MRSSITFLAIALFASGCAHYPVNAPLAVVDGRTGYRFENTAFSRNSDNLLLMLAFSGGGTRAAALDYGVLEELDCEPSWKSANPSKGTWPLAWPLERRAKPILEVSSI